VARPRGGCIAFWPNWGSSSGSRRDGRHATRRGGSDLPGCIPIGIL
jgi:hypothetical protein